MKLPVKQFFGLGVTLFIFLLLFASCRKTEQFPLIPSIEFKDYMVYQNRDTLDSCIVMVFSFKDGDGDIGYPDNDSVNKSIHVYYYKKVHGAYVLRIGPQDSMNFDVKLPMILNAGVKRPIKGDIEYTIDIYADLITTVYDTIYVAFSLVDRANNESNLIKSPEIVLRRKRK